MTDSKVTLSSLENIVALYFAQDSSEVTTVANVSEVEGPVSKYIVTAYRNDMSALSDVSAEGNYDEVVITYNENKYAFVSVPETYEYVFTVGSASVRAGHNNDDFSAISWVISK